VGRESEVTELGLLLRRSRLVTLTGTGGIGKTRLALEVAGRVAANDFAQVRMVQLDLLNDAGLVLRQTAEVLGERRTLCPTIESICTAIAEQPLLLVFDNCEQLLGACAVLVEQLLLGCPRLRVVATSREPLRITGEVMWRLQGLRIPEAGAEATPEVLLGCSATRLFVQRASAVAPGLDLDARTCLAIVRICQRLEGVPLAIELAAARANIFSTVQILERLENVFPLLARGSSTAPTRHRTLRATLDWSYGLLSEPDRMLLKELSVFVGGWTFEAAEAVVGADSRGAEEVLDGIARLVDKSLVQAEPAADGTLRYRLPGVLRQYAWQRLARCAPLMDAVQARHAAYCVDLAETGRGARA
jgi:predicted ATPase